MPEKQRHLPISITTKNPYPKNFLPTHPLLADLLFLFASAFAFVLAFGVLRALLLVRNMDLAADIPAGDLIRAFLVGARFDLMIASDCLLPLTFFLLFPRGLGQRTLALVWLGLAGAVTLFNGIAELEFYHEFHTRLNSIAFQYIKEDPATVGSMLWHGFPVVRYVLLWALLWALLVAALVLINRLTRTAPRDGPVSRRLYARIAVFFLALLPLAAGARGTLRSGPPLRWGDAFHSAHLFANHLALNGTYTLVKAAIATGRGNDNRKWLHALPADEALRLTRQMLLTDRDELLEPDRYAVLRRHTPSVKIPEPGIRNIVIIMMESFSGEYVGALGNELGITPEFDKLAQEGLLFDRFFSNGTHTHQGMFASLACFPNLPGFEYLMQSPEGQHHFTGLPVLLKKRGFKDLYVYNGDFSWDNQEGFFRNQGMSRFIGRNDYLNPGFMDATWGVADEDMFLRAAQELDKFSADTPFYAVLQSLSNHTPYAVPPDLPFEPITESGELSEQLTAMKYSDWALGQFFSKAKQSSYYAQTLFVILGDHGFRVSQQLSAIDLLRFHVPMLLIGPGIRETYGPRNHTVGTQTDMVPTVVSLLGKPFVHQCWGRDLLALPKGDPGLGMIKPSGSDQTVALIRGRSILVRPPNVDAELGEYALHPKGDYRRTNQPELRGEMDKQLSAFIATAMQSLTENRTGL